jgi:hypothetical protein
MAGRSTYELHDAEVDLYFSLREDRKLLDAAKASYELHSLAMKRLVGDAELITVDGEVVLEVRRYTPSRFDSEAFRRFDHRLYQSFVKPADAPVVALHWVGERP